MSRYGVAGLDPKRAEQVRIHSLLAVHTAQAVKAFVDWRCRHIGATGLESRRGLNVAFGRVRRDQELERSATQDSSAVSIRSESQEAHVLDILQC